MPAPVASNQTISFLIKRFEEAGIRLKHRHGQNFLIDLNLQRLLVDSAQLDRRDVVLEVGTGTGALSTLIAPRVAALVTVEIDPQLFQLASEELFGFENVVMLHQDVLRNKNNLHPDVVETVQQQLAQAPDRRLKVVANLPYSVATPVLSNLLISPIVPHSMTITIQKELADRIVARPSTKDYGALSIWIQSQCRTELVRILPPTVFWPRPKVTSAIVHLEVQNELRARIGDLAYFQSFVRSMFTHRRKFLRGVLHSASPELSKPDVDEILAQLGLRPDSRAEQLELQTMLSLATAVRDKVGHRLPESDDTKSLRH